MKLLVTLMLFIGRWEFEGIVATDIRDEYVGNSVGMGGQNPIRYKNV